MWPFDRLLGRAQKSDGGDKPSTLANPERWFSDFLLGMRTTSGEHVTPESAMRLAAVSNAVTARMGTSPFAPA